MSRDYQFRWAFATTKQSAYGTPTADGSLLKSGYIKGPDFAKPKPHHIRSNSQFGQGDEWARGQEVEFWDLDLARNFDLTTLLAGLIGGFALGSVTSSQPAVGTDPTVYDHDFLPLVSATAVQLPAMSIVEEVVAQTGMKKKIQDLIVANFKLSGSGTERLQISAALKGSGQLANSSLSMPAITAASFLRQKDVKLELGAFGGALTDVSLLLKPWEFSYDNDNAGDTDGYFPGSGLYRGRHEIGKERKCGFMFNLLQTADGQELDRLLATTNLAARLTATGPTITGIYKHRVIIDMPDIHYDDVEKVVIDGRNAWKIMCNINVDHSGGVSYPFKYSVRNDQSAYL